MTRPCFFQYWDQPEPPEEVAGWIAGFAEMNPDYDHQLFSEQRAAHFIAQHFRERAAFEACAVPAMQADYFRLCAIITAGGLYVDADNQCLQPFSTLLDPVPHALMLTWTGLINNAFIMFRQPRSPFLEACLHLATDNIEHRRFTVENTSTGPGVINAVRAVLDPDALPQMWTAFDNDFCRDWGFMDLVEIARRLIQPDEALRADFAALTLRHTLDTLPWMGSEQPRYKQTERHWVNWRTEIYR